MLVECLSVISKQILDSKAKPWWFQLVYMARKPSDQSDLSEKSELNMFAKKPEPKFCCFGNVFADLIRSSRWRKASKCKLHILALMSSIEVHQKRKECMVRQTRSDIDQLLLRNRFQETIPKLKHIYEDKTKLAAYAQVDYFCSFILQNFSDLKHQCDVILLPEETKEAVAGLIFAASRIGELKELQHIRSLFFERFGPEFDKDSAYLRLGNLVGSEIIKILVKKMPQDGMEISEKYQTNISTSVEPITEDSVSSNNLGFDDSDAVKIEILTTGVRRKNVVKEDLKFLHLNFVESQGRDRSLFMR